MQVVYLSNRPAVLAETWAAVRRFMPFVDRAVVVVPGSMTGSFGLGADDCVTLVDENELTGRGAAELSALDHVRRNVTLRRALIETDHVDARFLLSDDDYRPLKPVDESFFGVDGRDVGYYCHDLAEWVGEGTPFDEAQHTTAQVLGYLGAPRLAYSSHMPQVIQRDLWHEVFAAHDEVRPDPMLDEWSLYFNLASARHPERFAEPRVYRTMCWPPHPHEWQLWQRPPEYVFENFYPDFYAPGAVFARLPTAVGPDAPQVAVEKLVRWADLGRRTALLQFDGAPTEPWTKGVGWRRLTFRLLWALRKAYEYVSINERETISQIQGTLDRLERRTSE